MSEPAAPSSPPALPPGSPSEPPSGSPSGSPSRPAKPKPRSFAPMIIAIVAFGLFLCCGLAGTIGFLLFRAGSPAVGPVRDAGTAFLNDLEEGDYPHAYDSLCERTKAQYTAARFRAIASAHRLRSYSITNVSVERVNGQQSGSVTAALTYLDGPAETRTILLAKDGSTWRVCGQPY